MTVWMEYALLFLLLLLRPLVTQCKEKLHLAGVFPFTGAWPSGIAYLESSLLAVEHINRRTDVLPDYELNLHYGDSQVG